MSENHFKKHNIIIICNEFPIDNINNNKLARKYGTKFILVSSNKNMGYVFCDFGEFFVKDKTGEILPEGTISNCENNIITTLIPHKLSENDTIIIENCIIKVKKICDIFKFEHEHDNNIKNLNGKKFIKQVDSETILFKSLEESIKNPVFTTVISDNFEKQALLHNLYTGLHYREISNHEFCPVNSIFGSIAAQEAIKACTNYSPINQWLYLDFEDNFDKNTDKKIFIVGAGAIGCELLKNLAMMNIKNIIITDMDTIEKSNLNRQFLFKNSDIGKFKSECAKEAVLKMNPKINIIAQTNKLCEETLSIYDSLFFKDIACVMTALDNIEARLFVDRLCCNYQVPFIDSGTLGTKGNVQCVIPFLTELYSSSSDPPEETIPVCTLKSFPYLIEHCIQWARDLFEGLFTQIPKNFMKYKLTPTETTELTNDVLFIHNNKPIHQKDCIRFAHKLLFKYFHDDIQILIDKFPEKSLTCDDLPLWSGTKKFPSILEISENSLINQFIEYTANLWADVFSMEHVNSIQVDYYIRNMKKLSQCKMNNQDEKLENLKLDYNVKSLEFEKDNDLHIDFVTSSSNLRADNYKIQKADKFKTKGIAGKIIPALVTTTSLVSGFACLELLKIFQKNNKFNNIFINMALPIFAMTEPIKIKTQKIGDYEYSIWNKLVFKNITMQKLIDEILTIINDEYIEIVTITFGQYTFYTNGMTPENRLNMNISDIYVLICKNNAPKEINLQIFLDIDDSEPINCQITCY